METLYLLEEALGAKFKFEKLSKQFGCYDGSKFGFYEKSPDSHHGSVYHTAGYEASYELVLIPS